MGICLMVRMRFGALAGPALDQRRQCRILPGISLVVEHLLDALRGQPSGDVPAMGFDCVKANSLERREGPVKRRSCAELTK